MNLLETEPTGRRTNKLEIDRCMIVDDSRQTSIAAREIFDLLA